MVIWRIFLAADFKTHATEDERRIKERPVGVEEAKKRKLEAKPRKSAVHNKIQQSAQDIATAMKKI